LFGYHYSDANDGISVSQTNNTVATVLSRWHGSQWRSSTDNN